MTESERKALAMLEPLSEPIRRELRELRLWHWLKMRQARSKAVAKKLSAVNEDDALRKDELEALANLYDGQANHHLKFVQTLNVFFPTGDTAEKDERGGIPVCYV